MLSILPIVLVPIRSASPGLAYLPSLGHSLWPCVHNWAFGRGAKFGDGPVQHVDVVEKVHDWSFNTGCNCLYRTGLTMNGYPLLCIFTFRQLHSCSQIARSLGSALQREVSKLI
jgi:hypothetical protein